MKHIILQLVIVSFTAAFAQAQINSTEELIKRMMNEHDSDWFEAYTFIQRTIKYDSEGKVKGEETWYEAIKYPDNFRIDYGLPSKGNSAIYRNDSVYVFRDHQLVVSKEKYQEFLLIEGGMYHLGSPDEVLIRLKEFGYDVSKFYQTRYNGRKVFVFGAEENDLSSKQMWIDAKHFYILRKFSPFREESVLETRYDDFKKYGPAWIENKVSFYVDGNLIQDEYYENIDISVKLDSRLFDPNQAYEWHWYRN